MKYIRYSLITLIGGMAMLSLAQERPPVSDDMKTIDRKLINYWSQSTCYKRGDDSEPKVIEQCKKVCVPNPEPKQISASTCWFGDAKWLDGSSGKPLEDQNKNIPALAVKGGYCGCDDPIIIFAGDFFIKAVAEAGRIIEKVVCPALQALDIVIEFGSLAIPPPGKAIQGGMIAAIRTAKLYKYAYEAQDAAQEWANMIFGGLSLSEKAGCGSPPFSISKLVAKFLDFANVPDTTLPGGIDYAALPCPKGGCRGTRHGERENNKKPKSEGPAKSTAIPNKPTATPNKPTATPNKPTATPNKPTATPNKPTATPNKPTATPNKPTATPNKPTATPNKPTAASTTTASTSSFKPSATATADCKATQERLENSQTAEKRDFNKTLHSRRLGKRAPKTGTACYKKTGPWKIESFDYPSFGKIGDDLVAYGWSNPNSCTDYEWGHAFFDEKPAGKNRYHTEHVLEWSVITHFFTVLDGQFKQDEFTNPDPLKKEEKLNFCRYWRESWDFPDTQKMDNPAPQSGAKSSIQQRTPIEWIAANYPYREEGEGGEDFFRELTVLQQDINTPTKSNMFSENEIFKDKTMNLLITRKKEGTAPHVAPRIAIQRIRSVIGVFYYMQEKEVVKVFKDQKVRIGIVLDGIDKNLPKTPRQITHTGRKGNVPRTFAPWTPLNLGARWDAYMDYMFKNAKDKGIKFVEDNLKRLKDEYTSQKAKDKAKDDPKKSNKERNDIAEWARLREDIENTIPKLEAEWKKAKNWNRPW